MRTAAERDAGEIRREAELQAAAVLREARVRQRPAETEAEQVLRNARVRADELAEEMQRSLQDRRHQADEVLDDAGSSSARSSATSGTDRPDGRARFPGRVGARGRGKLAAVRPEPGGTRSA